VRRALPILVGLTILTAACGGVDDGGGGRGAVSTSPATVDADLLRQFDYDASAPLDVKELKSEVKDGAVVHDITYAGPEGRIDAFLITPEDGSGYPAVEFMPGAPGAKYTFYTEAIELAKAGVVSLLPNPPYARPPIEDVVVFKPSDKDGIVQEVKEMRRGIDLLVSRPEVDPSRLGYVGFSWGASLGGIFSAVERRVHSFVLMSLVPHLSTDMRQLAEDQGIEGDLAAYEEAMQPIDAIDYLPHAAPSAVFLQAGELDTRPSPKDTQEAFAAVSDPKKLAMYDAEHELNAQAKTDARAWLLERLGAG
jgi:cephalosporin-C deacetylase-like acetyl esterase